MSVYWRLLHLASAETERELAARGIANRLPHQGLWYSELVAAITCRLYYDHKEGCWRTRPLSSEVVEVIRKSKSYRKYLDAIRTLPIREPLYEQP